MTLHSEPADPRDHAGISPYRDPSGIPIDLTAAERESAAVSRDRRVSLVELRRVRRWICETQDSPAASVAEQVLARIDARIDPLS